MKVIQGGSDLLDREDGLQGRNGDQACYLMALVFLLVWFFGIAVFDKLESLVLSLELRQKLAESAYRAVLENCTLSKKDEMVTYFEQN